MRRLAALTIVLLIASCGGGGDDDRGGDGGAGTATTDEDGGKAKLLSASEVVEGLQTAGLPIEDVTIYDEASDPNELLGRPGQYTSKAGFRDARLDPSLDPTTTVVGDVEAFDVEEALEKRAEYLSSFAEEPVLGGWYQYEAGNVILRVTFDLPPDQAVEYEIALKALFES